MVERQSILLDENEIVSRVADVKARWGGVHWYATDAYGVVAKATAKKILIELQAIYSLPDLGMSDRRMGEFIQGLKEEIDG